MRVFRSLEAITPDARVCAVSIGNFDGVHAGHRRLLARNLELSRQHGWLPSILTFDPHPTKVVAPHRAPRLLTTMDQRLAHIAAEGIEQAFVLPFNQNFSQQTPGEFIEHVLMHALDARAVLVGDNFRFGFRQAGNIETLRAIKAFVTEIVPAVTVRGRVVSSTEIRSLIETGNVSLAARLLLRPYAVEGKVVTGFGIGSKQTVPTLNLATEAEIIPARGVYITRTRDLTHERIWPSITNIGTRPTFEGENQTIETFLLSPLGVPAPERIRVEFLRWVREERRFATPEALRSQILRDVARAQDYHRRVGQLSSSVLD